MRSPIVSLLALAFVLSIALPLHSQDATGTPGRTPDKFEGTRKMLKVLEENVQSVYKPLNSFATSVRVDYLAELAKTAPDNALLWVQELIKAGRQNEAIPEIMKMKEQAAGNAEALFRLDRLLGLAYLRQGEQDNCLLNHTAQSCLFPIGPGGYYVEQRGPRAAIEVYKSMLARNPKDQQTIWLMNIAYMTLAQYPDSVPKQWLLGPELFKSDYPLPRFPDVAPQLGLALRGLAGGSCTEDFDHDGDIDILISSWGMKSPMHFFRNNGDGTFTDATADAGLTGFTGGLNMIMGDYNNDGYTDVLVLRGAWMSDFGRQPNSLLRNNGDGTFTDVTIESGLLSFHPTQTAVFADLNNDGWLDIFIGNESTAQSQMNPCELFVNNGNGTFTERAHEVGLDVINFVKAVACGDYNNDGLPDIYLSCFAQSNCLFRNDGINKQGKWTFTNVTSEAGVGAPLASFPAFFFDYDNDGWEDIFVSSYGVRDYAAFETTVLPTTVRDYQHAPNNGEIPRLYHNNHNGTFSDVTVAMKLNTVIFGMGCNFGDLDNDGFLDIYVGTGVPDLNALVPNRMFRNDCGMKFEDVTTAGGFGHLQKGHAISFADLDNDGDQDVFAVMGGAFEGDMAQKVLFENPGNANHFISLKLEGVRSNRSAIGARITVTVATPRGDRRICKTVNTGGSFGASPLEQEIGLGNALSVRSVAVNWPTSKTKQTFKRMEMDRFYSIREDSREPAKLTRNAFHFAKGTGDHGMPDGMGHHHE